MVSFLLLFSEKISLERFEWISNYIDILFSTRENELKFVDLFITGEALYSLIDNRYQKYWNKIHSKLGFNCYLDSSEMQIMGIEKASLNKEFVSKFIFTKKENKLGFWSSIINVFNYSKAEPVFGFIQFNGPYMHRNSIYALNALQEAINNDLKPELYAYLDGLHLGHQDQKPSAFVNIGEEFIKLSDNAREKGLELLMLGCSRCGKARGYIKTDQFEGLYDSSDTIPSFYQCNLNRIINKFNENHFIIASNFGSMQWASYKESDLHGSPPVLIFITHGPYGSEWTFGGLSFAMACANYNIPTRVIFIEDGIYTLIGKHHVAEDEKIFNMQEMLNAILDIEYLKFYAYLPSFKIRNSSISSTLKEIQLFGIKEMNEIIMSLIKNSCSHHMRIMFF